MTKLLPDQISRFWPIVKYAIEESLPPTVGEHPDKMNRILSSTLSGGLDVWVSYTRGDMIKINSIVLTKITYDDASHTKNLLIYCLYGYGEITEESWKEGFGALAKYARSKGCSKVTALSSIPYVIEVAKNLGAETDYTFISFNLDKSV